MFWAVDLYVGDVGDDAKLVQPSDMSDSDDGLIVFNLRN